MGRFLQKLRVSPLELIAFISGMVVLAYELTAARITAPYLGATVYTWTSIIGVILAALAVGYAKGGIWADKRKSPQDVVRLLLAASALISIVTIWKDPAITALLQPGAPLQVQAFLVSVVLFAPATFCLGALSPYLARLHITSIKSSGQKLSNISTAGTIGSLAGTFLTGYYLFGVIGTNIILSLLAATLFISCLLIKPASLIRWKVVVAVLILFSFAYHSTPNFFGVVRDMDTRYSRVLVRDVYYKNQPVRVLQTDNRGLQSGVDLSSPTHLVFGYTRAFAGAANLHANPTRYLVIGGGAFTVPAYFAQKDPTATVDTVEINGELTAISRDYFALRSTPSLRIIQADGRQYINESHTPYDLVYLDAFSSIVPPFQLLTTEAVARYDALLATNGIIIGNFIDKPQGPLIRAATATFREHFGNVKVYAVESGMDAAASQNLLLIASRSTISVPQREMAAAASPFFQSVLQRDVTPSTDGVVPLTDDFAPIEKLTL